jgi:hypothetical protein
MSRRRPRRPRPAPARAWPTDETVELRDGEWAFRPVTGSASTKVYRCPGCDHEIGRGTPHVVAWPPSRLDDRRHWHTPCWARRLAGARPF